MLGNNILIGAAGAGGADAGHIIEGSGLFDGSSGYLTHIIGSTSNQRTFTIDIVFKLADVGVAATLYSSTTRANDSDRFLIQMQADNTLFVGNLLSGAYTMRKISTQLFRDPSGYGVVTVKNDTTQATAADRQTIYYNGVEITDWSTDTDWTSQNALAHVNTSGRTENIGCWSGTSIPVEEIGGYVARAILIDGQALDPTSFGEVTDDGFWKINKVEETYTITGSDVTGAATDNSVSSSVASTYTFSNQAIGTATSDRVVIVNFGSLKETSAAYSVTSVTIGGVAATQAYSAQTQTSYGLSSYYATVPTGTTADIVIVHSANMNRCGIQVVTTTNIGKLHQVALAEASSGSDALSFAVDVPAAGSLVVGYVYDTNSSSQTWTELTENFDEQISATHYHSGAIKNYSSAATPTITADPSGSATTFGLVAVFQPESEGVRFGTNGFLLEGGANVAAGTDSSTPDAGYAQNDSIPTMTNFTAPSGEAIYDSSNGTTYAAWKAFDKNTSTRWARNAAGQAGWIGYDFGTGKVIKKMILQAPSSSQAEMPKNYTIDGWNGSAWVTITTITNGAAFSANEQRVHTFTNTTSYNKYRVNITASEDGANCTMGELAMFEGGDGVNHFTKTGTITATSDSPTNDADNEYGNYCTWNPLSVKPSHTQSFSNGNLTAALTNGDQNSQGTIFFDAEDTDGYYFEVTMNTDAGSGGVGVAKFWTYATGGGGTPFSWQANGYLYPFSGGSDSSVNSYTAGDVVGFFVRDGDIWFHKNGTYELSGNPNADSNPYATGITGRLTPLFTQGGTGTPVFTLNTGQTAYAYTPPTNAKKIATQNLPTPAVVNYEDEYYIEAGISHSNGSTTAVTLPKTVSGGAMVRIKRTDSTGSWYGFDTVRGANKSVRWNVTEAESTSTFDDQNLTGTTFTMPSDLATGTYLLECFYVGSYFQIKGFVGDHPTVQTLSYDSALDSAPGFMVFFNRDGSTQERRMAYHISTGNASRLDVSDSVISASNAGAFGSFTPTTTQFKVGNEQNTNQDSANIISYHWANSGPYSFGLYDSNLNADGPMINLSGSPATFGAKRNDGSWNWVQASQILGDNENYQYLIPNDTTAINTTASVNEVDFLSNGMKMRDAGNNNFNGTAGADHLYWAFGIQPMTDGAINQGRAK